MGWLGRYLLLRFLPRRLLPVLTIWELYRLVRAVRRSRNPQVDPKTGATGAAAISSSAGRRPTG